MCCELEFTYDALGRRIRKIDLVSNKTNTYYYNDNWQVLCDYKTSTTLHRWFVYGNYIDEVLMINSSTALIPAKLYVHDQLYSPTAMLNRSTGAVYERYEYDAYGNCHILEPNFAPDPDQKPDFNSPYMFTGRELDILDNGSLKIMNYRHRYYDTYTGRFTTHDPLGYKNGVNLYEYVKSNPISMTDPHGACPCVFGFPWPQLVEHLTHCHLRLELEELAPSRGNCYFEWINEGKPYEKTYVECMADNPEGQPWRRTLTHKDLYAKTNTMNVMTSA